MIRYNTKRYWGKSTEQKPIDAQIGDRFLEIDTRIEYFFGNYNSWNIIGYIPFLKNQTDFNIVRINEYESIFNPSNLKIKKNNIFIIESLSDYYVLGDLINNGILEVNGTLKVGGGITSTGPIIGSGIIE
jgi:hypothetical protein